MASSPSRRLRRSISSVTTPNSISRDVLGVPHIYITDTTDSFNVDNTNSIADPGPTLRPTQPGVRGHGPNSRRPSFLYRSESQEDLRNFVLKTGGAVGIGAGESTGLGGEAFQTGPDGFSADDQIVTPFAKILHRLHHVRAKYVQHIGLASTTCATGSHNHRVRHDSGHSSAADGDNRINSLSVHPTTENKNTEERRPGDWSQEVLDELDWCIEHLEIVQKHKSVADLASTKFKRILNKELHHFAESGKAGSQVSEYLSHTFLDNEEEENEGLAPLPSQKNGVGVRRKREDNSRGQEERTVRSPMSEISVHRPVSHSDSCQGDVPKYGIDSIRPDSLDPLMTNIDVWGVDIFRINQLTSGNSLTAVAYTILTERDLLNKFSISSHSFVNYIRLIQSQYHSPTDVPYHNQVHAADVTQSVHSLLSLPTLQDVFTDIEQLAIVFAAAIHDVDHPGVTNQYLINTGSELALMYNDESVLENHHLAVAFKLMQRPGCDIFQRLPAKTRHKLRRTVIELVLATDMSKHMGLLAELKTIAETRKEDSGSIQEQLTESSANRSQVLQIMLHCADLSNPTKPLELYRQWTDRIMQEFFKQGDTERQLKMDISPMCDRYTATVEKSQIGFIDFIVQPLWETWADLVYPDCQDILDTLDDNRQWYQHKLTTASTGSSPNTTSPLATES